MKRSKRRWAGWAMAATLGLFAATAGVTAHADTTVSSATGSFAVDTREVKETTWEGGVILGGETNLVLRCSPSAWGAVQGGSGVTIIYSNETTGATGTIATKMTAATLDWTPPAEKGTYELKHQVVDASGAPVGEPLTATFAVEYVTPLVVVQPQAVDNTTAHVYTNGVEVSKTGEPPQYEIYSNSMVRVVYEADGGYAFQSGGSRTFDTGDFKADANPTDVPQGQLPQNPVPVELTGVTARQRYPWNGLVDLDYTLSGELPSHYRLRVTAVDAATHVTNVAKTLVLAADPFAKGSHRVTWDMNADGFTNVADSVIFTVTAYPPPYHDAVQLWAGGPYFATCNVGGEKPTDRGHYFWWGDTVGYTNTCPQATATTKCEWIALTNAAAKISFSAAKFPANSTYGKDLAGLLDSGYIDDVGDPFLNAAHDAAAAHWGSPWRLPTAAEAGMLLDKTVCTSVWVTVETGDGLQVKGRKVFGVTEGYEDRCIFLPTAGHGKYYSLYYPATGGYYLTSTPNLTGEDCAIGLFFDSGKLKTTTEYRYYGRSIRPVRMDEPPPDGALVSGDSAPVALDLRTGEVRQAAPTETLTYSTDYASGGESGATVDITVNGVTCWTGLAGEGTVSWTPTALGTNELHHIVYAADGTTVVADLVARFLPLVATVSYDADGGAWTDGTTVSNLITFAATGYLVPVENPVRDGYTFRGWYTSWTNGAARIENGTNLVTYANHRIHAKWLSASIPEGENDFTAKDNADPQTVIVQGPATNVTGEVTAPKPALVFPDRVDNTLNGKYITVIGRRAFAADRYDAKVSEADKLRDVVFSTYLTRIGDEAFRGVQKLTNLTFVIVRDYRTGEAATLDIGSRAFDGTALESVVFPAGSKTVLRANSFANIANLSEIFVYGEITGIDRGPFSGCGTKDGEVVIHLSPEYAADTAFVAKLTADLNATRVKIDSEPLGMVTIKSLDVSGSTVTTTFVADIDSPWGVVNENTVSLFYTHDLAVGFVGTGKVLYPSAPVTKDPSGVYTAVFTLPGASADAQFYRLTVGSERLP